MADLGSFILEMGSLQLITIHLVKMELMEVLLYQKPLQVIQITNLFVIIQVELMAVH